MIKSFLDLGDIDVLFKYFEEKPWYAIPAVFISLLLLTAKWWFRMLREWWKKRQSFNELPLVSIEGIEQGNSIEELSMREIQNKRVYFKRYPLKVTFVLHDNRVFTAHCKALVLYKKYYSVVDFGDNYTEKGGLIFHSPMSKVIQSLAPVKHLTIERIIMKLLLQDTNNKNPYVYYITYVNECSEPNVWNFRKFIKIRKKNIQEYKDIFNTYIEDRKYIKNRPYDKYFDKINY